MNLTPFAERYFLTAFAPYQSQETPFAEFRTDIRDMGDHYLLEGELAGYRKEEIRLELDGDCLTITAEHSPSSEAAPAGSYIRRERLLRPCRRSFDISGIYTEGIHASYENGILTLTLPKEEAVRPQKRHLEIH